MDTRTMILLIGIGYAVFGIMLALVSGRRGARDRSYFLAAAFLMVGLGSIAQSVSNAIPPLVSLWIGNTATGFGLLFQAWGVQALVGRAPSRRFRSITAGLLIAGIGIAVVLPSPARQIWGSLVYAALFTMSAWILGRWYTSNEPLRLAVTGGFSAVSLVFVVRAWRIFLEPEFTGIFMQGDSFAMAYLVLYLAMLTTGFGLLLLSKGEADATVLRTNSELSAILESLPTAMCVVRDGMVLHANPAAERLFGYGSGALHGMPIHELLAPESDTMHTSGGDGLNYPIDSEVRAVASDGTLRWIWLSAQPLATNATDPSVILSMTEITHMKALQLELEEQATTDELTGLMNRRAFINAAEIAIVSAQTSGKPLSLAIVDVDRLKEINDAEGHSVGDRALRLVADVSQRCTVAQCRAGRLGGDEFALLLPDCDAEQGRRTAERLQRRLLENPLIVGARSIEISISIGIAECTANDSFSSLAERADASMYQIKRTRRHSSSPGI